MRWEALWILPVLFSFGSSAALAAEPPQPRTLVVEVTAAKPGKVETFRAAIGHNGRLEFIEAKTPFKKQLRASSLTFLFEVTEGDGHVLAQLHGERDGTLTLFGNIGGKSGKITDEPWGCATASFGPF